MNCRDILESAQAEQVAEHVRICPSCARELAQQQAFDSLLRASILAEPVDCARVERNVRQSIASQSRRWMFAAAGIAAVLLLALGIRAALALRTTPVFAAAARDHRLEIVDGQPRKWFTDRGAIEGLAGGQGVSASALEAIAPAGYRLAKGKLCRLDGQFFLHLVYVNGSENFSVFLRHADGSRTIHAETQGAEHVAGFQEHQLTTLIVTEQPGDAAERFARSAAAVL